MALKARRRNLRLGNSTVVGIPARLEKGAESTIAADRIAIVDFRGKISPERLLEFLEKIEPYFWRWLEEEKHATKSEI